MKLAKKHASRIAALYNSIAVAHMMISDCLKAATFDEKACHRWENNSEEAATELYRAYGIKVIGEYKPASNGKP